MKLTWYKFSRDYQQKSVDPNFFHEYILIKDFVSFKKALYGGYHLTMVL